MSDFNDSTKYNPAIRWGFLIFIAVLGTINAWLTYQFGTQFLVAAFGRDLGMLASYAAGVYALIIFDIAFVCWFWVYRRLAESQEQRSIALIMSVAALAGSIVATVVQLANGAFGLVDLSAYMQAIGFVAMVVMIGITAGHIVAIAMFALTNPDEKVRQTAIGLRSDALALALGEARKRVEDDMSQIGAQMAADVRVDVLRQLGFDAQRNRIAADDRPALASGKTTTQPAMQKQGGDGATNAVPFRLRNDSAARRSLRHAYQRRQAATPTDNDAPRQGDSER